jgi:hypothetical protein
MNFAELFEILNDFWLWLKVVKECVTPGPYYGNEPAEQVEADDFFREWRYDLEEHSKSITDFVPEEDESMSEE